MRELCLQTGVELYVGTDLVVNLDVQVKNFRSFHSRCWRTGVVQVRLISTIMGVECKAWMQVPI